MNYYLIKKFHSIFKNNLDDLELVMAYLQAGLDYQVVKEMCHLPCETLEEYTQLIYEHHQDSYLVLKQFFSFQTILEYIYDYETFKRTLRSELLKKLSYPIILIVSVYSLLVFFLVKIFPMMFDLIKSFDVYISSLQIINIVLWIMLSLLTLVLCLIIIVGLLLTKKQNQKMMVIIFHRYSFFNEINRVYTHLFAYNFKLLHSYGASTKQIIEIMKSSSISYFVKWLAQLTSYELEEGRTLQLSIENELLDKQFIQFIQLSSYAQSLQHYLNIYLEINELSIHRSINKIAKVTKIIAYSLLAMLIIMFYQVLLTPLQMMNSF